jgi:hypothetical protein
VCGCALCCWVSAWWLPASERQAAVFRARLWRCARVLTGGGCDCRRPRGWPLRRRGRVRARAPRLAARRRGHAVHGGDAARSGGPLGSRGEGGCVQVVACCRACLPAASHAKPHLRVSLRALRRAHRCGSGRQGRPHCCNAGRGGSSASGRSQLQRAAAAHQPGETGAAAAAAATACGQQGGLLSPTAAAAQQDQELARLVCHRGRLSNSSQRPAEAARGGHACGSTRRPATAASRRQRCCCQSSTAAQHSRQQQQRRRRQAVGVVAGRAAESARRRIAISISISIAVLVANAAARGPAGGRRRRPRGRAAAATPGGQIREWRGAAARAHRGVRAHGASGLLCCCVAHTRVRRAHANHAGRHDGGAVAGPPAHRGALAPPPAPQHRGTARAARQRPLCGRCGALEGGRRQGGRQPGRWRRARRQRWLCTGGCHVALRGPRRGCGRCAL